MIPHSGLRGDLHRALPPTIPVSDQHWRPHGGGVHGDLPQGGQARALETRSALLVGSPRRGGVVEGRIKAQASDHGDVHCRLASHGQQLQRGKLAIRDDHHLAVGQPAPQQNEQLAGPVQHRLVAHPARLVVAFRGSQHAEATITAFVGG